MLRCNGQILQTDPVGLTTGSSESLEARDPHINPCCKTLYIHLYSRRRDQLLQRDVISCVHMWLAMTWFGLNFCSDCSENMVTVWNTLSREPLLWPVLFSANCDDVTIGFLELIYVSNSQRYARPQSKVTTVCVSPRRCCLC